MYLSVRFEDGGNGEGRLDVYVRKSFTCRIPIGSIGYRDGEEREAVKAMVVANNPEVEVIGPEVQVGSFVEVYYKG